MCHRNFDGFTTFGSGFFNKNIFAKDNGGQYKTMHKDFATQLQDRLEEISRTDEEYKNSIIDAIDLYGFKKGVKMIEDPACFDLNKSEVLLKTMKKYKNELNYDEIIAKLKQDFEIG